MEKENAFATGDYLKQAAEWKAFYEKFFKTEYDFSNIAIPEKSSQGRWRLLIIVDLTLEQLYAKCKELFEVWRLGYNNLDEIVVWNERDAKNGAYAIWVRDEKEADEGLKNLSANNIKSKGITTETLAERLVHELKFYNETGKHLDIKRITFCAGSRDDDGRVPSVGWRGGGMGVSRSHPGYADGLVRARGVVSL